MAVSVIRQLNFEELEFDVVLSGSMFEGGRALVDPMAATIREVARGARMVRLTAAPVLGAVMIGMEKGGIKGSSDIRKVLADSIRSHHV